MKWTPVVIDGLSVELLISCMIEEIQAQASPDDLITPETVYQELTVQLHRAFSSHGYGSPEPRELWCNVRTMLWDHIGHGDWIYDLRVTHVEQKRIHLSYLTGNPHVSLNANSHQHADIIPAKWRS